MSDQTTEKPERGHWNRVARRGGGDRSASIVVNRDHAQLLVQEAQIRREFGEEGVRRFWEAVNAKADR